MAEEPGELNGEGDPEVGVDGSATVCDGHGQRDEAGASRYLTKILKEKYVWNSRICLQKSK